MRRGFRRSGDESRRQRDNTMTRADMQSDRWFAQREPQDWQETDLDLGLPTDREIERLADMMHRVKTTAGRRDVTPERRAISLYGERHFARVFRLRMDLTIRKFGNSRRNFRLRDGTTVDVITRIPPKHQPVPDLTLTTSTRSRVDVLVLIAWHGKFMEPEFVGWIEEAIFRRRAEVKAFHGIGTENYVLSPGLLNPGIHDLMARHNPRSKYALPPERPTPSRTFEIANDSADDPQLLLFE